MDSLTKAFRDHVLRLEKVATTDFDSVRRDDAVRSLAAISLLLDGWRPGGGGDDGGGEVVDFAAYRQRMAA